MVGWEFWRMTRLGGFRIDRVGWNPRVRTRVGLEGGLRLGTMCSNRI